MQVMNHNLIISHNNIPKVLSSLLCKLFIRKNKNYRKSFPAMDKRQTRLKKYTVRRARDQTLDKVPRLDGTA